MKDDLAVVLKQMRADFVADLPERCDRLERSVLALEQGVAAFDELYRQVHSLKGSGGTFGLSIVTTICHQFESFISQIGEHFDGQAASFALKYVDLLRRAAAVSEQGDAAAVAIEKDLAQLRAASMSNQLSVLLVEPSAAMRNLCQGVLVSLPVHLVTLELGLSTLERLLYEPFDLLVASRELPDLNAVALLGALRESNSPNQNIPAILISSNPAPTPEYLRVTAMIPRDPQLVSSLSRCVTEALAGLH